MSVQKNYIVFLCYGYERVFHECAYSLLSLSSLYGRKLPANTEIWIYTDNPGWFSSFRDCCLPLNYRIIDEATVKKWRGEIDFVHRVKIETLKDLIIDKKGNILYVDTDTVFMHLIEKMLQDINDGKLYMHIMEGKISEEGNPVLRKLDKHLLKTGQKDINGTPMRYMAMWNAGVLGFNTKYAYLLGEALAFTDREYPEFPKHIVEQWAFSVLFQQEGMVRPAAPCIFHYWKMKEAQLVLSSFFDHFKDKNWEELTRLSTLIQMHALMQEKVDFFHNRGVFGSLLHRQWAPTKPKWSELLKQV